MGWNKGQAKAFAAQVRRRVGPARAWMTPEVFEAIIAEHVLLVVLGQHREAVDVEAVRALLEDVRRELDADDGAVGWSADMGVPNT